MCLLDLGESLSWEPSVLDISTGDIVQWIWSLPSRLEGVVLDIVQVDTPYDGTPTIDGFSSGAAREIGKFSNSFVFNNVIRENSDSHGLTRESTSMNHVIMFSDLSPHVINYIK